MPAIDKTFLSDRTRRISIVIFAFLLFYLVSFLIDPYANFWSKYFERGVWEIIIEWFVSFLFCYLMSEATLLIHRRLNRKLPWTENPSKRLVIEGTLNICAVLLFIILNMLCIYLIYHKSNPSETELNVQNIRNILQWVIVSLIISFIIVAINTGSYLINNWKSTELQVTEHKLRVAELGQASIQAELNTLKLQLDPHFIFNNLSVLSELILEDPKLGYEYSENFSKVYRFLLVNSKKNIVSLKDEIKFLNAYIFLIQHRIGAGVHFEIDVNQGSQGLFLPPLTLQLLIENALKHNRTSKNNPLRIKIYTAEPNTIIVENSLLPMEHKTNDSTGIGLTNIVSRFNLLSKEPPQIISDDEHFKVIIHLMEYDR